jgi:predicted RNA-binding Zn ribbon-like protein
VAPIRQHQFKLAGGHPALEFINTVRDWTVPEPHDYLTEFADAIRFSEAAGLLTRADVLRLRRRTPHLELTRLRELRALLKRIFQMRLSGKAPSSTDLEKLSAGLAEAARATRLRVATQRHRSPQVPIRRDIAVAKAGDALLRLRIVEAAVALLVSDAMLRVKSCPSCGWFFLDVSKNRSRRWCSMATCGSVAKARRYYRRSKERAERS